MKCLKNLDDQLSRVCLLVSRHCSGHTVVLHKDVLVMQYNSAKTLNKH